MTSDDVLVAIDHYLECGEQLLPELFVVSSWEDRFATLTPIRLCVVGWCITAWHNLREPWYLEPPGPLRVGYDRADALTYSMRIMSKVPYAGVLDFGVWIDPREE